MQDAGALQSILSLRVAAYANQRVQINRPKGKNYKSVRFSQPKKSKMRKYICP